MPTGDHGDRYHLAAYLSTYDNLDVYASDEHGEPVDNFDRRAALVKLRAAIDRELDNVVRTSDNLVIRRADNFGARDDATYIATDNDWPAAAGNPMTEGNG